MAVLDFEEQCDADLAAGNMPLWRGSAKRSLDNYLANDPLLAILERMAVPQSKRTNLAWLDRHLAADYLDHPDMPEALRLLREEVPCTVG